MSTIHFIGGEKGGVGKSVVARLLAQYWIDRNQSWQGFDTDRSHGALLRYYEGFARPIEVAQLEELDRIMEAASAEQRQILVDLAAQTEAGLHDWIDSGGVLPLAEELGVDVVFWHVMDDGKDSVALLERLLDRYGDDANYVVVLNHGRGSDFSIFRDSEVAHRVERLDIPVLSLRSLHKPTMLRIDRLDKSFWAAANHAGGESLSLMERQRVKVWTRHAYAEFEKLGL